MAKFQTAQVVVGTSPVALAIPANVASVRGFIVKAPVSNAARIFIGTSGVSTSSGYPIEPGDEFEFVWNMQLGQPKFDVTPADVYVVGTAGDVAVWIGGGH